MKLRNILLFLLIPTFLFTKKTCEPIPDYSGRSACSLGKKIVSTLIRNRPMFYIGRYYTALRAGIDFTYNKIIGSSEDVLVDQDILGAIRVIYDGKLTPLILGSIPSKQRHIDQLQKSCGDMSGQKLIGIFTLNEAWECRAAGLSELVKDNKEVVQYQYPTQDMTAPKFIDLLRAVRDLEDRDRYGLSVVLVHCKAGRGRSATVVAAYLAYVVHKAGRTATVEQIEAYIVDRRPQVRLSKSQKNAVIQFCDELKKAGTLENLCEKYKAEIRQRQLETCK